MISDAVKCDVARDFAHGCFVVGVSSFPSRALSPSASCLHLVLSVLPGVEDVVNIEKGEVKIDNTEVKIDKREVKIKRRKAKMSLLRCQPVSLTVCVSLTAFLLFSSVHLHSASS